MKRFLIYLLLAFAGISQILSAALPESVIITDCQESCATSQNTWLPRSFGSYPSRELFMVKTMHNVETNRYERFGTLALAFEYMHDFGQKCKNSCKNLGTRPFWSGTNIMTYGTNNGESYIDAYQMGMGDVIGQGTIELNTTIMHFGGDLLLHFTQDIEGRGAFFKLRAPIGVMRVDHKLTEKIAAPNFVANELTNDIWLSYPSPANRYSSATEFFQGGSTLPDAIFNSSLHKPLALENGRISDCPLSTIKLGDLALVLGYNVYGSEKGYVTLGVKATAPTGNVPTAKYVTEPIFGNGGYWAVGLETTGHWKIWHNECETRGVDFWAQGEISHLFFGRRPNMRSFDLKLNGKGSKYLITQFYFPSNPVASNPTGRIPSFLTSVVNITTLPVISSFNAQGALALMFDVIWDDWNIALGSEFWSRTKERLTIDCCSLIRTNAANLNDFAVLGRQVSENASGGSIDPLYLCQPDAKINQSEDRILTIPSTNPKVKDARLSENRIPSNYSDALDICGAAATAAMTIKVLGQAGYTWKKLDYTPNVSVIWGVEMSPWTSDSSVSLWSVGAQGSINF